MKRNYTIKAAVDPNGGYTTEDVLDYFINVLGWDPRNPHLHNYADAVAEYMDMAYQADPTYTMDDWYADTKANYPEEIEEFEVSSSVPDEYERILHTKLGDMESLYLELVETVKLIKRDIKRVNQDPDMVDQVSEDLETALDAVREIHQIMAAY